MSLSTMFVTYQVVQIAAIPFVVLYLFSRALRGKKAFGKVSHRFGFVPRTAKNKKVFWLHAVSVGEVLSIQSLIKDIKKIPNSICYVTTGTMSGKKMAETKLDADHVSLMPLDFLLPMKLAFRRIKPKAIIIVEAELWPNFLMLAHYKNIPTYSINARISTRSHKRYKRLKKLLVPLLNIFRKIYVQSPEDEAHFKELGIVKQKLTVLGNLKTINVLEKQKSVPSTNMSVDGPVILVGSIHPGELSTHLNLFKALKQETSALKLVLAPRHFHWKKELIKKVEKYGYSYALWDNSTPYNLENGLEKDILLVCKLGVLFDLYQIADVFCLGGTFVPIGGHNLLEPAVWAKPSVVGPHHQNCKAIANALEQKSALIKVPNERELIRKVRHLIKSPNIAQKMGLNAKKWLQKDSILIKEKLTGLLKELKKA